MEHKKTSSGVAKGALATAIGAAYLGISNGGGILNGNPVFPNGGGVNAAGYVTVREMALVQENGAKDAVIAKLEAEKYTDAIVAGATIPLANRICELEKESAVNKEADKWYRRYADATFLSKPDTFLNDRYLVTREEECCCDDHRHHGRHRNGTEG